MKRGNGIEKNKDTGRQRSEPEQGKHARQPERADGRTKRATYRADPGRQERSGLGYERTRESEACSGAGSEYSTHAG